MNNLVFSMNATVPIFLVMALGYFARRVKLINDEFCTVADSFNYKVALPVLLFRDIVESDIRALWDTKFAIFCGGSTVLSILIIWAMARKLLRERGSVGSFVQGSFRCSVAVFGVAFMQSLYGVSGLAPLAVVIAAPLYNLFSVTVFTVESAAGGATVKKALLNIIKNPIILGILAGILYSLTGLGVPSIAAKSLNIVSNLATPLALVVIGGQFDFKLAVEKLRTAIAAASVKLIFQPLVFIAAAIALGFRNEALASILIMLAAPTTPFSYVMAKNMHGDEVLASEIVVLSTVASAFTFTAWIFALRSLGFI